MTTVITRPRQNLSKEIGVDISHARTKRHLDKFTVNKIIETQNEGFKKDIATLKERGKTVDESKLARHNEKIETLTKKSEALSKTRIRFSHDSSFALSTIYDAVIEQLATHAMDAAHVEDKKTIQVIHIYAEGIKDQLVYPLIEKLPIFKNPEKYNKKNKKEKENNPPTEDAKVDAVVAAADDNNNKTTFKHYIDIKCKNLINKSDQSEDNKYRELKVGANFVKFCSELLVELTKRLSILFQIHIEAMNKKTIDRKVVLTVVKSILIDGCTQTEEIKINAKTVQDNGEKKTIFDVKKIVHYPDSGYEDFEKAITDKCNKYDKLVSEKAEKTKAKANAAK